MRKEQKRVMRVLLLLGLIAALFAFGGCGQPEEEEPVAEETPRMDVSQVPAERFVAMDGYLLDGAEAAIDGYTVTVSYSGSIILEATTNSYGYFSFPQMPLISGLDFTVVDATGVTVTESLLSLATGEELTSGGVAGALSVSVPEAVTQVYLMLQVANGELSVFAVYD